MLKYIKAFPSDMVTSEEVMAVHDLVSPSPIVVLYIFLSEWIQYCPSRAPSKQASFPEVTEVPTQAGSPVSSIRITLSSLPILIKVEISSDDDVFDPPLPVEVSPSLPGKLSALLIILYISWLFDVTIISSSLLHSLVKHKVTEVGLSTLSTFKHPAFPHESMLLIFLHFGLSDSPGLHFIILLALSSESEFMK